MIIKYLEKAINQAISNDPPTAKAITKLSGKCIALELKGLKLTLYAHVKDDYVNVSADEPDEIDATISGSPIALFSLAKDPHSPFKEDVNFSGDVEISMTMQQILKDAEIDWQAALGAQIGLGPTHIIARGLDMGKKFITKGHSTISKSTSDFIHHETKSAPTKEQSSNLRDDIYDFVNDVDRLSARFESLDKEKA